MYNHKTNGKMTPGTTLVASTCKSEKKIGGIFIFVYERVLVTNFNMLINTEKLKVSMPIVS